MPHATPSSASSAFFEGVRQQPVTTSAGPCELPILYRDASLIGVFYRVDPAAATAVLGDLPLEPMTLFGKAIVFIAGFEYRETTIGPYGELAVAIQVRRKGTRPSWWSSLRKPETTTDQGLYVVNLPVTMDAARAAGVDIWGFPKYVSEMETEFGDDGVSFRLGDELHLTMGQGRGLKLAGMPFTTFSVLGDSLVRTVVATAHKVRWGGASSVRLEVTGDGPSATTVRVLGLPEAGAAFAFRGDALQAILPAGTVVGTVSAQLCPPPERAPVSAR